MGYKAYPNPFDPLTPAGAWVLGLWFADGNIYLARRGCYECILSQTGDLELLQNVSRVIRPPEDPGRVSILRFPREDRLLVNSKDFAGYLQALGITTRKSLTMKWPSWVSRNLAPHFVRGLMDGDGSIHHYKGELRVMYYCGSPAFIEAFADAITSVVGTRLPVKNYGATPTPRVYTGGRRARALCTWMYEGSTERTRLRRKYELYAQWLLKHEEQRKLRIAYWKAVDGTS